jgi:hypothetical protein
LLALGVNSALALRPSFVDVYSIVPEGDCVRARFQSERFDDLEQDTPLAFRVDESTPPDDRPVVGTCIHIRRSWGWAVFYRALTLKSPPEVAVLAEATHHFSLPIEHAGRAIRREPRARVLASLTLEGPWRPRIEMTERTGTPPQIELLEQGVRLLSQNWFPEKLPLRALLDADFLPTNASRSALRKDRQLETARKVLREGLGPCLAGVAQVLDGCESPPGLEILDWDLDALGASFGVAAGAALEAMRAGRKVGGSAKAFVDLPILRDAIGRPLSTRTLLKAARNDGCVLFLRASEPLPLDHGSWMERVVWFNGPHVEAMLSALPLRDVEPHLDDIRAGVRRRNRWLASPGTGPVIPTGRAELLRERFHIEHGSLSGLAGELTVSDPRVQRGGRYRYFVEQRLLETEDLDPDKVALPLDVALEWAGHIRPTRLFEAVERNTAYRQSKQRASKVAIAGLAESFRRLQEDGDDEYEALRLAGCLAFGTDPVFASTSLRCVALWRTADGGRVALVDLPVSQPVCVVSEEWLQGRCLKACDGRSVLIAGNGTNPFLGTALKQAQLKSVSYERGLELAQAYDATQTRKVLQDAISTSLREMGQSVQMLVFFAQAQGAGFIAPSAHGKVLRFHVGHAVAETSRSLGLGTTTVAIEEWSLVPTAVFGGVEWPKHLELREPEAALCDIVIRVLEGQTEWDPSQVCFVPNLELVAQHSSLRSYLLGIADELRAHVASGHQIDAEIPASLSRIVNLKMLNWVDEREGEAKASIRQITSFHCATVPLATVPLAKRGTMPRPPKGTVLFDDECEKAALEEWFPRCPQNMVFAVSPKAARQPPPAQRREGEARVDIGALLSHPRSNRPLAPPARRTRSVVRDATSEREDPAQIDDLIMEALAPSVDARPADPIAEALGDAVARLPSMEACSVEDATQGPMLRYDASRKRLRVRRNRLEFVAGSALSQHALRALTAAGMAEINRELDVVTDAEERRALVKLFHDWATTK